MFTQITDDAKDLANKAPTEELYGLSVDTSILFSDHKGRYNKRIERRQRNLLSKLKILASFMTGGEKILYVTRGCSPATFVEQILTGVLLQPLKGSLFVITNRRILHIPVTMGLKYRHTISQILFTDCQSIRFRWATLIVKYKSGKCEKFRCIERSGRKNIKRLLGSIPLKGIASPTLERGHLCPRCTKPLIKDYYICPHCSLKFKTKGWATALSMLLPGGGYFYARHWIIGLFEAIMETIIFIILAATSAAYFISSPSAPRSITQAIALCGIILLYEKLVTALFSNMCIEDFIPKKRKIEMQHNQTNENDKGFVRDWRSM